MTSHGKFYGIGVGPGEPGLLPVIAWETLKQCDLILVPRAQSLDYSAARRALPSGEIPEERFVKSSSSWIRIVTFFVFIMRSSRE